MLSHGSTLLKQIVFVKFRRTTKKFKNSTLTSSNKLLVVFLAHMKIIGVHVNQTLYQNREP
jgi:hypothetical protein